MALTRIPPEVLALPIAGPLMVLSITLMGKMDYLTEELLLYQPTAAMLAFLPALLALGAIQQAKVVRRRQAATDDHRKGSSDL